MNQKQWKQDEIDYLIENYANTSYEEMSYVLGRTISSIMHKAQRLNIQKPRQWTEDELNYLKDNYQSKTYRELAEYLGRTKSAVDLKINQMGLHKDVYTYNHSFFHNIDTEEKAYWLGFIYADGCIRVDEGQSYQLVIQLMAADGSHLKKFNKSLCGNLNVTYYDDLYKPNGKIYKKSIIRVSSKEMVNDLISSGATPRKSLTIQFPVLRNDLIRHFIRGYFDGDGSIFRVKRKNEKYDYIGIGFTSGSADFLDSLRKILYDNSIPSYFNKISDNYREINIRAIKDVDNFLHFIYDDATIYLDRKFYKKQHLYEELQIEQRLLRQSEKTGLINLSEKENGNPETGIRVEGCV